MNLVGKAPQKQRNGCSPYRNVSVTSGAVTPRPAMGSIPAGSTIKESRVFTRLFLSRSADVSCKVYLPFRTVPVTRVRLASMTWELYFACSISC